MLCGCGDGPKILSYGLHNIKKRTRRKVRKYLRKGKSYNWISLKVGLPHDDVEAIDKASKEE